MGFQTIYKQIFFIMKEFLKKNFTIIVLVISVLSFFKSCGDARELSKIRKEILEIKEKSIMREEFQREIKISGLEAEKRMIQATDRKLLDVRRQTEIENEIKKLSSK